MTKKINVHIADDHKILIEGVIALLHTEDDIQVNGYSLTGKDVVEWMMTNETDVLILDINMPIMDGIDVLRLFKQRGKKTKTIVLSSLSDPKLVQEMIALGASGFLDKSSASEYIIDAVRSVNMGVQYFTPDIKTSLFDLYLSETQKEEVTDPELEEQLTEKEIKVLQLITKEKNSTEIADLMNVSVRTVETYRRNLYKKIKVKNVVGLAMYAIKNNLV